MANQPIRYITMPNGDVLSSGGPQFCKCSTGYNVQTKEIQVENIDAYTLPYGYTVNVLMTNFQGYNGTPNLTVNGRVKSGSAYRVITVLGSTPIYRSVGVPATLNEWGPGEVITLTLGVETEDIGDGEYDDTDVWYIIGQHPVEIVTLNGTTVFPDNNRKLALVETDPTVPSWAKQSKKPTYTAEEVGALADPYVLSGVDTTKADNGISETVFKNVRFTDENGNGVAHITVQARPDGSTSLALFAVNYRNQTNYASGIRIVQKKDGTSTYTVNDADAFRDAIEVYSTDEIDAKVATLAETKSYLGIS